MIITAEISYYPLTDNYATPVNYFIELISDKNIKVEAGKMSTILIGDYNDIMELLKESMDELMKKYPSIFNIKISNSCPI
ncbi:MAG: YkoF family thiamine/hydroxymethylpyrimidine-binding protein [Bacteroidales bacterium]|nr:YkoF family thiamine/hydroxymethylpyrimidine-binding protein [Bacteroidales bacterium]